jgi:hypothetical protein
MVEEGWKPHLRPGAHRHTDNIPGVRLERYALVMSWGFLLLVSLPSLLAAVYWLSLLFPIFSPSHQWSPAEGGWTVIITLVMLMLGLLWAAGWKNMQRLRRAVQIREPLAAGLWAGSLGYNLILLTLSLVLPWPFGWHDDDFSPLLAFLLYGLPAAISLQAWLSAMGWWTARSQT